MRKNSQEGSVTWRIYTPQEDRRRPYVRKTPLRCSSQQRRRPTLALAINYATRPLALTHIQSWYEGTDMSEDYPDLPLSSQSLSRMLSRIGESTANLEFSRRLIQHISTCSTLVYDITSVSSYSQSISLLEYGYNRDGLELPQINLSLIVDKDLGIPVMYDLYPGEHCRYIHS